MAGLWTWASLSPGISALPVRTLAHIWRVEGHKGALQALPCTNACVVTSRSGFSSCVRFLAPDSSRHSACPARGCRRRSKRGKPFPGSMSYRVKKVITPPIVSCRHLCAEQGRPRAAWHTSPVSTRREWPLCAVNASFVLQGPPASRAEPVCAAGRPGGIAEVAWAFSRVSRAGVLRHGAAWVFGVILPAGRLASGPVGGHIAQAPGFLPRSRRTRFSGTSRTRTSSRYGSMTIRTCASRGRSS